MEGYEIIDDDILCHYGRGHLDGGHSGRYPWGSGDDPHQHQSGFGAAVRELRAQGLTDKEIWEGWGISSGEFRSRIRIDREDSAVASVKRIEELRAQGLTNVQIAKELGLPGESSVRSIMKETTRLRAERSINTANMLKEELEKYGPTDVGKGMENRLGITDDVLQAALVRLQDEGYNVNTVKVKQVGTGKQTTLLVLTSPEMGKSETYAYLKENDIHIVKDPYSEDGGKTWGNIELPQSISSKRVYVRYSNEEGTEGGIERDGLIEIRPGVEDLSLGNNTYAQVRIAVDGTKYMKGMAVYNANIPEGYDVIYNSKKTEGKDPFKEMKMIIDPETGEKIIDKDNPFGSTIKSNEYDDEGNLVREIGQRHYIDKNGKKQLSAINILNEEGDWANWSKTLASQFLSKQSPELAEKQLGLAYDKQKREFDEIMALDNPTVKERLLMSFADDCDAKAASLKAAPLPGQQSHVIIPFPEIKDGEVYAPNYPNGTIVSLVRFPHEGTFQIPTLVVNNNYKNPKNILGTHPVDAIGINVTTANKLSGADFDGDSVLVLPNPGGKMIKSRPALKRLKDYSTEIEYPHKDGDPIVGPKTSEERQPGYTGPRHDGFNKGRQMGAISNLITDMTIQGAEDEELERAVRHSMCIIDAEKHNLDWKRSERENRIPELKEKYQKSKMGGVSTLISKSTHEVEVPKRKQFYKNMIDPETGKINWEDVVVRKVDKDGNVTYERPKQRRFDRESGRMVEDPKKEQTQKVEMMYLYDDARKMSSGTVIEGVYAEYANKMKLLANESRKTIVALPSMKQDPNARKAYAKEVESLNEQIQKSLANKPLERKAQQLANKRIAQLQKENPNMTKEERKKRAGQALTQARQRMGANRYKINISPREWEAIQAGALPATKFKILLDRADLNQIKSYATPRNFTPKLSKAELALAKQMLNNGYKTNEVCDHFGVSFTTLNRAIDEQY